jgi:hypothetical protein
LTGGPFVIQRREAHRGGGRLLHGPVTSVAVEVGRRVGGVGRIRNPRVTVVVVPLRDPEGSGST